MKYIDADLLRKEIEHRIDILSDVSIKCAKNDDMEMHNYYHGKAISLDELLSFIDSLQQEQQDKKEVKFVFPKFLYARTTNNKTIDVSYAPQSLDAVEYIRSDSLQQEQPDEPMTDCHELEEAARAYSEEVTDGHNYRDLTCGFIAGAEWQKAKMMEGAVEGLICATITGTNAISFLSPLPKELTAGSEVRIIILPKEDE